MDPRYTELRVHLKDLRPIMERFRAGTRYEYQYQGSIGFYPRIRLNEEWGPVSYWLDLWMGLNEQGCRFEEFFPSIPYDIDGGVFLDEPCEGGFMRYGWTAEGFHGVPCCELVDRLIPCLVELDSKIKQWGRARLLTAPDPTFIPDPRSRRSRNPDPR